MDYKYIDNLRLKIKNFVDNVITFNKIQQIGAYKTLANLTGATANLTEVNWGSLPQSAVTLSGNVTYTKADFNGSNILFLQTNNTATRTFTISNTGFVANDMIMLLIDQNSSGDISITIGSRSIPNNRGNIINAIFDGTNWHVWSGGGVFNTVSNALTRTSFGLGSSAGFARATSFGNLCNPNGTDATAIGYNVTANNNSTAVGANITTNTNNTIIGQGVSATQPGSNAIGELSVASGSNGNSFGFRANQNGFSRSNAFGAFTFNRRYGSTRFHLGVTNSSTDATVPSYNKEWISWAGTTSNATITELFLRGVSSNRCVLQAKNAISFKGQAVAFRSDYTGTARWNIEGSIKRDGSNNTTLVGVTTTLTHSDGTGGTLVLTIDADDTNEALRVQVTGNASETWTWLVELELLDLRIA